MKGFKGLDSKPNTILGETCSEDQKSSRQPQGVCYTPILLMWSITVGVTRLDYRNTVVNTVGCDQIAGQLSLHG